MTTRKYRHVYVVLVNTGGRHPDDVTCIPDTTLRAQFVSSLKCETIRRNSERGYGVPNPDRASNTEHRVPNIDD